MYNPTSRVAQVSLGVDLDQGSADPFQLSVQPFSLATVTSNTESRIPLGIGHAAWLHSTNGVGVVAERLFLATASGGPTGVAEVMGSRLQARQWLVTGDAATVSVHPSLDLYNPGTVAATVTITLLPFPSRGSTASPARTTPSRTVTVPAGRRSVVSPSSIEPLLVTTQGNGQVVVEGDTSPFQGIGIDAAIGVPLSI